MKILSDGILSSYQVFKSRLRNPFSGAFLLSWLIINWEFWYYLLFQNDIPTNKIIYINQTFYSIDNMVLYPLYSSIAYIILFPLISNLSSLIWNLIDKTLKSLSSRIIEGAIPLTNQDKQQLLEFMRSQISNYEDKLKRKNLQIESLSKIQNMESEDIDSNFNSETTILETNGSSLYESQNSTALELKQSIETKEGLFNLQKAIALKFHKDIDNSHHFMEVDKICLTIQYALKMYPDAISARNLSNRGVKLNTGEMESIMSTLKIVGILDQTNNIDDKANSIKEYRLSNKAMPELLNMTNGYVD